MQRGLGLDYFRLPTTQIVSREKIRLPIVPELTNEQISYVIGKIKEFYDKK